MRNWLPRSSLYSTLRVRSCGSVWFWTTANPADCSFILTEGTTWKETRPRDLQVEDVASTYTVVARSTSTLRTTHHLFLGRRHRRPHHQAQHEQGKQTPEPGRDEHLPPSFLWQATSNPSPEATPILRRPPVQILQPYNRAQQGPGGAHVIWEEGGRPARAAAAACRTSRSLSCRATRSMAERESTAEIDVRARTERSRTRRSE